MVAVSALAPKAQQAPEDWVREQVEFESGEDGATVTRFRIEAKKLNRERFRTLVSVVRKKDDTPETLAAKIDVQAARCKEPMVQVSAFLRGQVKQPVSIYPWPVEAEADDDGDDDDASSSSTASILDGALYRQLARHNEILLAKTLEMSHQMMQHLAGQNDRHEREREAVAKERLELFEAHRLMVTAQDEQLSKAERWRTIGKSVSTFADAIAFRMTRGNVAPDAHSATLLRGLKMLGSSITPEQSQQLAQVLTMEQLTTLATLTSPDDVEESPAESSPLPETETDPQ